MENAISYSVASPRGASPRVIPISQPVLWCLFLRHAQQLYSYTT